MKRALVAMLVVIALIQLMAKPGQAVTCGQVDASLAFCIPYLTGGGNPPIACCDGVKTIKAITPTTADRRAACNCPDAASSLPQKCGIEMGIPISQAINCENIN
ncbi:hypothetical protein K2173_026415 [Erythroxylum novogranatense]|uniref:Non-specific lipid-transfer protein n=1 Tax=Erythroxylum novogranatense TaxID=1862640 RepID=A0AAV8SP29_9ROSI|nr:hypothetical protein K2173_026415 [Erythroxylum novogranatense]